MPTLSLDRRAALRLALAGLAALPVLSRTMPAIAAAGDTPVAPVEAFNQALLAAMRAGGAEPFRQRFTALAPAVDRAFDLSTILRVSVGARWASMSPDEQARLEAAFRTYTVANFVANFDSDNGKRIQTDPAPRALANGDQVVSTQITGASGSPTVLAYVMRQTPAGWKAVDVLADGSISRVATQRSDFRGVLSNGGGPALVASLQNKVVSLSGGALA
jgi:phospholipid transport system substrate-binding protein